MRGSVGGTPASPRANRAHAGFVASADVKFVDAHLVWNFFEWLFRIDNRERNQNGARPRRNFVDVEPEPVGEKNDLWRDRGDSVVIVLTQEAEINFSECV